jgi:hypothetical protein
MNSPVVETPAAYEWIRGQERQGTTLPLDEFLTVRVLPTQSVRDSIKAFLGEHCSRPRGIDYIAARGKLTAQFITVAGENLSFGELVKHARSAVRRSEAKAIRKLDPRDLARAICTAV